MPSFRSLRPVVALALLAASVAAPPAHASDHTENAKSAGLKERSSKHSFEETVAKVRAGIAKRPLKLFAEIDHAEGASGAGLNLSPSTLFIFGNPKGGTPLMTKEPRMGIALPLKMHVYEADGTVMISYPDMAVMAQRYELDASAQPIPKIAAMLDGLANEAAE